MEQTSALARVPYIAVAELTGTAAQGRILLAAPITQGDIELRFAAEIETADEISFDRNAMALRARRKRTLHAITLSEAPMALTPSAETARVLADGLIAAGVERLPWSKPTKQWRDRVMFLRKAEGNASQWPDLSDDALATQRETWLAPALYDKTSLKDVSSGDLSDALMNLLPWELRARLEREAPTHFEAPTGTQLAIDYEAEQGPDHPGPSAGIVRPHRPSLDRERRRAAGAGVVVTGASSSAGNARFAGLLARLICGGALRFARALSPTSLAGRSGERDADPPREASRHINTSAHCAAC